MASANDKNAIRRRALEIRRALSAAEVRSKSTTIERYLEALSCFQQARALLVYVASKDNEVDTLPIIRAALERGVPVHVPVVAARRNLCWPRLRAIEDLRPGPFGILEPALERRQYLPIPQPTVCLVPGLAFTRDGHRLGYGGGYFDRFLAGYNGTSIGLAYECQIIENPPVYEHDRKVNCVVTEGGVQHIF